MGRWRWRASQGIRRSWPRGSICLIGWVGSVSYQVIKMSAKDVIGYIPWMACASVGYYFYRHDYAIALCAWDPPPYGMGGISYMTDQSGYDAIWHMGYMGILGRA
jgi:hypothetical protein